VVTASAAASPRVAASRSTSLPSAPSTPVSAAQTGATVQSTRQSPNPAGRAWGGSAAAGTASSRITTSVCFLVALLSMIAPRVSACFTPFAERARRG
jgi:hypothetical protein